MDDPIDAAFQSRRFAHGKSKGKSGRSSGASKPFNPLSTLGRYEVSLGAGILPNAFEIHELTEDETGLLGSLDFGRLAGLFVLAGSQKGLAEIVAAYEQEDEDEVDEEVDDDEKQEGNDSQVDDEESGSHGSDDEERPEHRSSAGEMADCKANRRARAFEKNSFRNPKFWMRWKGTTALGESGSQESKQVESDMGYLVFANNACDRFEGTITCRTLDWKQLKMKGWKVHSKASACPMAWNDLG